MNKIASPADMLVLSLMLAGCSQNRAQEIDPRSLGSDSTSSIIVFGAEFVGENPKAPFNMETLPGSAGRLITVSDAPKLPAHSEPERRGIHFQRLERHPCLWYIDWAAALVWSHRRGLRYHAWRVPPGVYAGPPLDASRDTSWSFVVHRGKISYLGNFAVDRDWKVTRTSNIAAASKRLGVALSNAPVGQVRTPSGVICTP